MVPSKTLVGCYDDRPKTYVGNRSQIQQVGLEGQRLDMQSREAVDVAVAGTKLAARTGFEVLATAGIAIGPQDNKNTIDAPFDISLSRSPM